MSKWYEFKPLTDMLEVMTQSLNRSELNDVIDQSLRLMRDHSIRKTTASEAAKELEEVAGHVIKVRASLCESLCPSGQDVLPSIAEAESMDSEEAKELKKKLSQLVGACDRAINNQEE